VQIRHAAQAGAVGNDVIRFEDRFVGIFVSPVGEIHEELQLLEND
jgi:hypothetical protein